MKKIIIENMVVELDETQELEVGLLFPELGAALENESEVRIELIGSDKDIEQQLNQLEEASEVLEPNLEKVWFVNQSPLRGD